jgi:hypothetical protein
LCQLHTLIATSLNLKSHIAYVDLISSKKFSHISRDYHRYLLQIHPDEHI